ncbi:Putative signal transducing protein [Natronincola peptidivorans]|uniref:Putative signal transducing protein n=1 Tax=Natronincola peptidivorans TaxID=426128 RepID=A0A1I0FK78_9FIRM|nr:DUF2007 domain-containing protein [Natronincola peptidivorans]SET58650.1 Putative signal transducing protein [Natronincola peptidivorans]
MPWCPKCKLEYRDGFEKCNDCKIDLIEELEKHEKEAIVFDTEVLLTSVTDHIHADIIEAKLNDSGIPVLKKHREIGGYLNIYMGMTSLGIDIYVPSKLLEEAKEIISLDVSEGEVALLTNDKTSDDEEAIKKAEKEYKKKRLMRVWIILLFFMPGFIWLIYGLITMLINLFSPLQHGIISM